MDTKAISKAAKKLAVAEARLVRVVANKEVALAKAAAKYVTKIEKAETAVADAKTALTSLVAAA
jgi:hypothetical protein